MTPVIATCSSITLMRCSLNSAISGDMNPKSSARAPKMKYDGTTMAKGAKTISHGIDILRAIRSFDPCMPCTTHIHSDAGVITREVNTCACGVDDDGG